MRAINWHDYYLNFDDIAFVPVAADGVRVHYGGLVNHGPTKASRNSNFVILDAGGDSEENPTVKILTVVLEKPVKAGEEILNNYGDLYGKGLNKGEKVPYYKQQNEVAKVSVRGWARACVRVCVRVCVCVCVCVCVYVGARARVHASVGFV